MPIEYCPHCRVVVQTNTLEYPTAGNHWWRSVLCSHCGMVISCVKIDERADVLKKEK
jgi:hypothetical protein